jgi:hypothetical protein
MIRRPAYPRPLIGIFRRVFRNPDDEEPQWTPERELHETEKIEEGADQQTEHRGYFVPYDIGAVQRQVEMIRAAIGQGGKFGDHEIPVPWLRMMLAGLEGRAIDQDTMWEGIASPLRNDLVEESPTYRELFPSRF